MNENRFYYVYIWYETVSYLLSPSRGKMSGEPMAAAAVEGSG